MHMEAYKMTDTATSESEAQPNANGERKQRKAPVRSGFLFPVYDYATSLAIAEKVELGGAGRLGEDTLAINLGQSVKSSSFRLRVLSAKQFGLVSKQGGDLVTSPTAKAILKPTSERESAEGMVTAFLNIPLFRAVADRYKGQPLPEGQALRNILEREFRIEASRVQDAERKLKDSARDTHVLRSVGSNVYLDTELQRFPQPEMLTPSSPDFQPYREPIHQRYEQPDYYPPESQPTPSGLLTITAEDFAEIEDNDFQTVWGAMGKVIQARAKKIRRQEQEAQQAPPADSTQLIEAQPTDENR